MSDPWGRLAPLTSVLFGVTAKTLNFIGHELFLPVLAGGFIFGVCSGLAILCGAVLPKWLGSVAIVIGIAVLIPPTSFPTLFAFLVWSIVVAILMYLRSGAPVGTGSVPATQAV